MTKSSKAKMPNHKFSARSPSPARSLLVLIFRILLLGVGGLAAGLLGVLVAQFYPDAPQPVEELPWLEQVLRRSDALLDVMRPRSEEDAIPTSPNPTSSEPASPNPTSSEQSRNSTTMPAATPELRVTLPSDTLFAVHQTSLRPDSQALLVAVVNELQRYPGATIRIVAHTDTGRPDRARSQSFAQAQAIEQYLTTALGSQYRWVAVGSGQSEPLVTNDTPANRQRNRRVEIGIDPHS